MCGAAAAIMPARFGFMSHKNFAPAAASMISQITRAREEEAAKDDQGSRGSADNHTSVAGVFRRSLRRFYFSVLGPSNKGPQGTSKVNVRVFLSFSQLAQTGRDCGFP
jgi:hypothetical protein